MNCIKLMIATAFLTLLFSTSVFASSRMYVTADILNVRSEPKIGDNIIKTIEYNTYVKVENIINGWAKVRTVKGFTAYCYAAFLSHESPKAESQTTLLGNYTLTYYCNCEICCGNWSGSPTASGVMPRSNHTVASASLPFGTKLLINGENYVVEDRGNLEPMQLDIYVDDHNLALQKGRVTGVPVYLVE